MPHITKEELELPRKASEIRKWVNNKIEEIGSTDKGKHAVRFRKGLCKELIEEALPLGIFCEQYFNNSDKVTISHHIGGQNYEVQRIRDAAERKSKKKYPDNTGLIIIFDNHIAFREKTDLNNLSQIIHHDVLPILENFSKVFILGWSSNTYLEFN